ncbi:MAG: hypothetical protein K2G03_06745 [Bacilli bacterium]|nr:hypothetical protein [Bacilli bacterium]
MSFNNNKKILEEMMKKYKLDESEKDELWNSIKDIFNHKEFQRRMSPDFPHHDKINLGEHILEDTIVTYILSKKVKRANYNRDLALKISMFHDFYIEPWQNNLKNKNNKFHNKHGFRHPIEAIIAAMTYFPEYFEDIDEAKIIIDGVLHHMHPFPVRKVELTEENIMELNNWEQFLKLDSKLAIIMLVCTSRNTIGKYSFSRSLFKEGRVMSKADKIVSKLNMKESSIAGFIALVSGRNKNLDK